MTNLIDPFRQEFRNMGITPNQEWTIHNWVFEIVNEWQRAGVIYFGLAEDPNSGHPFITITDFGKECIESGNFIPYDPDGYINELKSKVPSLDDVTLAYLRESIATYNSEHLLSCNITLGTASENMILVLIDAFIKAIADPNLKNSFERRIEGKGIYAKYNEFRSELDRFKSKIPADLTREIETYLDQTFQFIRINRNKTGHPTGISVNKKVAYSNLQVFAEYSKRVFELMDYLSKNQI